MDLGGLLGRSVNGMGVRTATQSLTDGEEVCHSSRRFGAMRAKQQAVEL